MSCSHFCISEHSENFLSTLAKPCDEIALPTSKVERPEIILWLKVEVDGKDAAVSDVNRQKRLHTHSQKLSQFLKHYVNCQANSNIQFDLKLCINLYKMCCVSNFWLQCVSHIAVCPYQNLNSNIIKTFIDNGQLCHDLYLYLWQQMTDRWFLIKGNLNPHKKSALKHVTQGSKRCSILWPVGFSAVSLPRSPLANTGVCWFVCTCAKQKDGGRSMITARQIERVMASVSKLRQIRDRNFVTTR